MRNSLYFLIFLSGFFVNLNAQIRFQQKGNLVITFPNSEDVEDTVSYSGIRLAGHLKGPGKAWINGVEKHVYSSLAFVGLVPLEPGDNRIEVIGKTETTQDTLTIFLYRIPPRSKLSARPTIITSDLMLPNKNTEFYKPGKLKLRFRGSPGGKAEARIPGLDEHIPMIELKPSRALGLKGVYETDYQVPVVKKMLSETVEFKLQGVDGKIKTQQSKTNIKVYSPSADLIAETINEESIIFSKSDSSIITSLPAGIRLNVVSRNGNFINVSLASDLAGYIHVGHLRLLPSGTVIDSTSVSGIGILADSDWLHIDLAMENRCSFQIMKSKDPRRLVLTLFYSGQSENPELFPWSDQNGNLVKWRQAAVDRYELEVLLNWDNWGYKVRYFENELRFSIRKQPVLGQNPFENLIFSIDAGHGGDESGAVGATGLLEKNVNLKYAIILHDLLKDAGANVYLTRTKDTTRTLKSRFDFAESKNSHIFIWCHNNSIEADINPSRVRGTSVFAANPLGMRLAGLTLPHLLKLGAGYFGEMQDSFYATRRTEILAFLVEGAFISNPEDEMLLMDDEFLFRLANAVFNGIKDFIIQIR